MLAPTPASPESVGMSQATLDRIEAHLKKRYIDAGRFPGTQLLVFRRGKSSSGTAALLITCTCSVFFPGRPTWAMYRTSLRCRGARFHVRRYRRVRWQLPHR